MKTMTTKTASAIVASLLAIWVISWGIWVATPETGGDREAEKLDIQIKILRMF